MSAKLMVLVMSTALTTLTVALPITAVQAQDSAAAMPSDTGADGNALKASAERGKALLVDAEML